jgi:hypothetical protein
MCWCWHPPPAHCCQGARWLDAIHTWLDDVQQVGVGLGYKVAIHPHPDELAGDDVGTEDEP